MSRWAWGQVYRMLKRAFKDIVVSIIPELCIVSIMVFFVVLIKERKNTQNPDESLWSKVFQVKNMRLLIFSVYGYLLIHATILRRDFGQYKPKIITDLYFLRPEWYEVFQTIENLVLFLPLGMLLFWSKLDLVKAFLVSLVVSLMIEIVQIISGCGTFEIADILLNVLGALVGWFFVALIYALIKCAFKRYPKKRRLSQSKEVDC